MAMSLRDQLLKAGLVTEEAVKQAESHKRQKTHQNKKNKKQGAEEVARKTEQANRRKAEQQVKREQDRKLNRDRDRVKRRRENAARIRQLIAANRVNDNEAEQRYNFQAGKVVRNVRVTDQQQRQLAAGMLGIARNPHDEFDFPILPRETAEKLVEIDPKLIVVLFDLGPVPDEDDWGDWPDSE